MSEHTHFHVPADCVGCVVLPYEPIGALTRCGPIPRTDGRRVIGTVTRVWWIPVPPGIDDPFDVDRLPGKLDVGVGWFFSELDQKGNAFASDLGVVHLAGRELHHRPCSPWADLDPGTIWRWFDGFCCGCGQLGGMPGIRSHADEGVPGWTVPPLPTRLRPAGESRG